MTLACTSLHGNARAKIIMTEDQSLKIIQSASIDIIHGTCIIQVNEKSCRLRMGAYRDGVKRKGDKIGMGV